MTREDQVKKFCEREGDSMVGSEYSNKEPREAFEPSAKNPSIESPSGSAAASDRPQEQERLSEFEAIQWLVSDRSEAGTYAKVEGLRSALHATEQALQAYTLRLGRTGDESAEHHAAWVRTYIDQLEARLAASPAPWQPIRDLIAEYYRIRNCSPAAPWCDDPTYGNTDHYDRHIEATDAILKRIFALLPPPPPQETP